VASKKLVCYATKNPLVLGTGHVNDGKTFDWLKINLLGEKKEEL
jgi:hypothetical protein